MKNFGETTDPDFLHLVTAKGPSKTQEENLAQYAEEATPPTHFIVRG